MSTENTPAEQPAPAPAPAAPPAPGFGPAPVVPAPGAPVPAAAYGGTVPQAARVGAGPRFGAQMINIGLAIVTLGIGWLIWTLVTWSSHSANPGQRMLGLTIVKKDTGVRLTWGEMFVRNFLLGGIVLEILSTITLTIVAWINIFKIFGAERQTLVDSMAGSVVVRANG
jgi:uncharacterized RDD family membrane protein YckC